MNQILVTGGTGLVGSRLLTRFVAQGFDCRGLVRPGKQLPDGVHVSEGDLLQPDTLAAAVEGVTAIVHLAASFRSGDDELTRSVNLEGTTNLIAAAQAHAPGARFVMASTSNVYSADQTRPAREDDDVHPTQAYPASKVRAEQELRASGLNWSILRLPFVYGDGDEHIVSALPMMQDRMKLHPAKRMSTAHHEDIAAAFALALTGVTDGRTVNVADGAPPTVYELAQIVGHDYSLSAEPLTNPWQGVVDTSTLRGLGFRPAVPSVFQAAQDNRL